MPVIDRFYVLDKYRNFFFMLYWLSSYCIMTIMIIVYKMVVLLMAYCTCAVLLFFVCILFIV